MKTTTKATLMVAMLVLISGCTSPAPDADGQSPPMEPGVSGEGAGSSGAGNTTVHQTTKEEFSAQEFLIVSHSDGDSASSRSTRIGGDDHVLVRSGALRLTVEAVFTASVAVESWRVCAFADGQAPDRERLCATGTDPVTLVIEPTDDFRLLPGEYFVLKWVNKPDDLPTGAGFAAMFEWHATVEYPSE